MEDKPDKKDTEKENVKEIFNVAEKNGEITVKVEGKEEIKEVKPGQIKSENKILRNFIILVGVLILGFLVFLFFSRGNSSNSFIPENFSHKGVNYETEKMGNLTFYRTSFPVVYQGREANYRIWTRKDPRELEKKVPIKGEFLFKENIVLKPEEDLKCEDGVIAVANFLKLNIFGTNVTLNKNATCESDGDSLFINLRSADETSIIQTGPACYNFNINNCEILEVTERYMFEVFSFVNHL